jgi:hypothetical protein
MMPPFDKGGLGGFSEHTQHPFHRLSENLESPSPLKACDEHLGHELVED